MSDHIHPMTHKLKTWPHFFRHLVDGTSTFEVRKDDRDFQKGDTLLLREYDVNTYFDDTGVHYGKTGHYTGNEVLAEVTYTMRNCDLLKLGHVAMGIRVIEKYLMPEYAAKLTEGDAT